jgi:uncharacterized protein involved in outer membrane biogenesis
MIRWIVAVVVVAVVVVILAVNMFADRAVKAGIEAAATEKLKVPVAVGDVDLSILAGRIAMSDLSIDNPPGYKHERLLELDRASVKADIKSLLSDTVLVSEIKLDGVDLVIEQKDIRTNNLQEVLKTVSAASGPESPPGEAQGRKLHIDTLEISDITVNLKLLPIPGKADTVTVNIDPIKMTDLGSDDKLDTAALSAKVLYAIAAGVAKQAGGKLPLEVLGPMKSELAKVGALKEEVLKEGTELLEKAEGMGEEVTGGIKKIFDGLRKKPAE